MRGGTPLPRANLIGRFLDAMRAQATALDSVVLRIRTDFRTQLKGRAASLPLSIPRGPQQTSFDGKLWVWWDQLEFATQSQEAYVRLAEPGFALEATHNAIRLTARTGTLSNGDAVFSVSSESAEAKVEDGQGYLAIGLDAKPGLPLTPLIQHIRSGSPTYTGNASTLRQPLYSSLQGQLVSFDRTNLTAIVRFSSWDPALLPYLRAYSDIDLDHSIFLTPNKSSYDPSRLTKEILGLIGNPSIATADANAARAMALPAQKPGTDPITPAARVLWDAPALQSGHVRSSMSIASVVQFAAKSQSLNQSQERAVRDALVSRLAVIWGPPGTGKTKTLVGLIHALAREASDKDRGLKILISGPTYKSVEQIVSRLVYSLKNDPLARLDIYFGHSRSRNLTSLPSAHANIEVRSFHIQPGDADWMNCQRSLSDPKRITIFATSIHQAHKIAEGLHNSPCAPVFDTVILDESSQIPVSLSLSALAELKNDARLVVAGDHLQMPPIVSLEPPVGAEYLVGSIQTYLLKRRFGIPIHVSELHENYRSSSQLVEFARTIGYPVQLSSAYPTTAIHCRIPIAELKCSLPPGLLWSDAWSKVLDPALSTVALLHDDDLSSQSNEVEAKIIASLLWCLRQSVSKYLDGRLNVTHFAPTASEFWSSVVGIVTPHRAQRAAVIAELRRQFPNDSGFDIAEAVDTVERFQGDERQIIVVSFAVGDPDVIAGEEAFLMQLERTNVAISRAMAKCIVVMPTSLAGHIPEDRRALETAHVLKGYVDEFCNHSLGIKMAGTNFERNGQLRWRA
jgi:hypothetical protein